VAAEHRTGEQEAAAERFGDLVDELVGSPGVTSPRGGSGFGRSALRWEKKIFAMLVRGRLVVKLPAPRVDALVAGGDGVRFDANKGITTVLLQRSGRVPDLGRSGVEPGILVGAWWVSDKNVGGGVPAK
jgi:hypothetical protein